jgi:hypothetical protein
MEFRDILSRRRMHRAFLPDPIPEVVISANESLYHARYNEADKLASTGGVEVTDQKRIFDELLVYPRTSFPLGSR